MMKNSVFLALALAVGGCTAESTDTTSTLHQTSASGFGVLSGALSSVGDISQDAESGTDSFGSGEGGKALPNDQSPKKKQNTLLEAAILNSADEQLQEVLSSVKLSKSPPIDATPLKLHTVMNHCAGGQEESSIPSTKMDGGQASESKELDNRGAAHSATLALKKAMVEVKKAPLSY